MAKATPNKPIVINSLLSGNLALGALIAELIGSFILTLAVLNTGGNIIVASLTVLVLVLILSKLSGGHINPVTTISLMATRQISWRKGLGYLIAQFLGGMLAVVVASRFVGSGIDPATGAAAKLYAITVASGWKPFFAELLGATIFGFGVSSAFVGKKEGYEGAFTIAGALLLGLLAATTGSTPTLNPAVALAASALDLKNQWGVWSYAVAPAVGGALGALLYKLLQSDVMSSAKK